MAPGGSRFTCRFTDEDSTKFASKYTKLIGALLHLNLTKGGKSRLIVIGFIAHQLAKLTVLMSRINISQDDIATVKEYGK